MQNQDLIISQLRQRLEILWQLIERQAAGGGGTGGDSYTKQESDARYVQKENGKGLSSNDFTDAYKDQIGTNESDITALSTALGTLESDIDSLFTPSNITVVEGGTVGADTLALVQLHQPIRLNNLQYYYMDGDSSFAYYFAIDNSGSLAVYFACIQISNGQLIQLDVVAGYDDPEENGVDLFTTGGAYTLQTNLEDLIADKQDELTFDNVPTNGSNNPVKSDGIYDWFKQDKDAIKEVINKTKNYADTSKVVVGQTAGELTFSLTNGVYSITGTSSGAATSYRFENIYFVNTNTKMIPYAGDYVAQIYPHNSKVRLVYYEDGTSTKGNVGQPLTFTVSENVSSNNYLRWEVQGGTTLTTDDNFTLMITPKAYYDFDNTFVPYKNPCYEEVVDRLIALENA